MKLLKLMAMILSSLAIMGPQVGRADQGLNSAQMALEHLRACQLLMESGAQIQLDPYVQNTYIQDMTAFLSRQVVGQPHAVAAFTAAVNVFLAGLNDPSRPLAKILLAGPTGVGKTELVRAFIRFLGGDPDKHMVRIDGGEFQDGTVSASAKGAGPSYVGYGEKDAVLLHPDKLNAARLEITLPDGSKRTIVVLLLDEIEKFHLSFMNLLLGPLDNGRIRLGDGTMVNFRDVFIFGTTNLGAKEVTSLMKEKMEQIKGKSSVMTPEEADPTGRIDLNLRSKMSEKYREAISAKFTPEFNNRWDGTIEFHHLTSPEFFHILNKRLAQVQSFIFQQGLAKIGVLVTEDLRAHLVENGTNPEFGARFLERTVNSWIQLALATQITSKSVKNGDVILLDVDGKTNHIKLSVVARGLSHDQLRDLADKAYPGMGLLNAQFDVPNQDGTTPSTVAKKTIVERLTANPKLLEELNLSLSDEGRPGTSLNLNRRDKGLSNQRTVVTRLIKISGRESRYLLVSKFEDNSLQADIHGTLSEEILNRLKQSKEMSEDELQAWLDQLEQKVRP